MSKDRKLKILAADDTPHVLKIIEMRLTMAGHAVILATDGEQAVIQAQEHKPDMVLLDIMMPNMNGLEALIKIKKFSPNIPIAMVSASTANEHLKEALNRGAIGYISKPINFTELDNLIKDVIQKIELSEMNASMQEMSRLAALGEVSGRVAHEILNPITSILGRIESMLEEEGKTKETGIPIIKEILQEWKQKFVAGELESHLQQKVPGANPPMIYAQQDFSDLEVMLNEIIAGGNKRKENLVFLQKHLIRVIKIVDNLRGLARKSEAKEEVDVNRLLQDTKELMHDTLWKRGIHIVEQYEPGLPRVIADPNELMQVFTNLTKNAADAVENLPENRKAIRFSTHLNGTNVEIRITDKGPGIPKDKWDAVFEASYTTKGRSKGTGLGLSISRRFIRNFDGNLVVEKSVEGVGTQFLIVLPIHT